MQPSLVLLTNKSEVITYTIFQNGVLCAEYEVDIKEPLEPDQVEYYRTYDYKERA